VGYYEVSQVWDLFEVWIMTAYIRLHGMERTLTVEAFYRCGRAAAWLKDRKVRE